MAESRIQVGASQDFLNTNKVTTSAGEVHNEIVEQYSFESTVNTTFTPLEASATFTGEWEQNNQSEVMVSMKTDGGGTLYFDFSNDGVNADSTFPVLGFTVAANIHEFHTAVKGPRYFRVRYVNGTTEQTYMRLYTYYGTFRASNTPNNQSIDLDSDGAATRPTDFQDEVVRGLRSGVTSWNKFGYRDSLTDDTEQVIWASTQNLPTIITTPSTFTITYNNTTDGAGRTGALSLVVYYLDADGNQAIAVHTLGSTGSDVTSFTGLGINRVAVNTNGGLTYNANTITITATTGGSVQAVVPALGSVTQQALFHVGFDQTAVMQLLFFNVRTPNKAKTVVLRGYLYNRLVGTRYEIYRDTIDTSTGLVRFITDPVKFKAVARDVVYFTATASGGGDAASIVCRFSLNLYDNK
tara:strand:+ start:53 stop:1282 length:1230 start_codon:yes stop_codon:yes gene_type:complete